jgi:hypothetical protein
MPLNSIKFLFLLNSIYLVNSLNNNVFFRNVRRLALDKNYQLEFEKHLKNLLTLEKNYYDFKPNITFNCDTNFSDQPKETTSVHKLKPTDIKVVAALGDSLTAAIGGLAKEVPELLVEYRGNLFYSKRIK